MRKLAWGRRSGLVVLPPLLCVALAVSAGSAELPAFYRTVDRVFWVVDDIGRTAANWKKLGILGVGATWNSEEGVGYADARFGNTNVVFIQPHREGTVYARYREKHGQGVMALVHRAPTMAAMEQEEARLRKDGVALLISGRLGPIGQYRLFDTAAEGKYVLGLICGGEEAPQDLQSSSEASPVSKKVSQFAFVARDLVRVSEYWMRLGFPEMSFTHPALWDLRYHGRPGRFDAILGWQRHGNVVYEWIQPTVGPTTYLDHMNRYGEGLHHIALDVSDIEQEKIRWSNAGFPTTQSGAWGERDHAGHGRFAYQDTHAIAGTEIELLWNYSQ